MFSFYLNVDQQNNTDSNDGNDQKHFYGPVTKDGYKDERTLKHKAQEILENKPVRFWDQYDDVYADCVHNESETRVIRDYMKWMSNRRLINNLIFQKILFVFFF